MDLTMDYTDELKLNQHDVPKDAFSAWCLVGSNLRTIKSSSKDFRVVDVVMGGLTVIMYEKGEADDNET